MVDASLPVREKIERHLPKEAQEPAAGALHQQQRKRSSLSVELEPLAGYAGIPYQRVAPPDTDGAAGTTHYVQATNAQRGTALLFIEKATGSTHGPYRLGDLAPNNHPCSTDAGGDPIVVWDVSESRWWISEFTSPNDECGWVCHYVSTSADPLGDYTFYAYRAPHFPDYPHYASNGGDLFFGSIHDFSCTTFSFEGSALLAYDRKAMLAGSEAKWVYKSLGKAFFPMAMPVQNDSPTEPGLDLTKGLFTRSRPTIGKVEVFEISVNWAAATPVITVGPTVSTNLPSMYSTSVANVPQKGASRKLDVLADRDMYSPHFRRFAQHDVMVGCRTVKSGNRAAPLWWKLERPRTAGSTWTLADSGLIAPPEDGRHRWMCSPSLDRDGTVVVGFSYSDPTNATDPYPGIGYQAVSPASVEYRLAAGSGAQLWADRWGDYSALEVDPSDQCTFWFTTEVVDVEDEWATRIGKFRSTSCA